MTISPKPHDEPTQCASPTASSSEAAARTPSAYPTSMTSSEFPLLLVVIDEFVDYRAAQRREFGGGAAGDKLFTAQRPDAAVFGGREIGDYFSRRIARSQSLRIRSGWPPESPGSGDIYL